MRDSPVDLQALPELPGCYLFSGADGTVIYVGKARNLRRRVSSYFSRGDLDPKSAALVSHIAGLDFIVTTNEVEALILENTLIKKHWPRYNIRLKDSKTYAYILRTDETYPRFVVARQKEDAGTYYGPFVSGLERDQLLKGLRRAFRLRTCRKLPKRACLRYHMGSCSGPCIGAITPEEYAESVLRAEECLKGRDRELLETLREEMAGYSAENRFEQALARREQIRAIEALAEHQRVDRQKTYDEDVLNYIVVEGTVYLALFKIHLGTLTGKQEFVFDFHEEFLPEFLVQYYAESGVPKEVVLPEPVDPAMEDYLSEIKGRRVRVTVPKRGDRRHLLDLVKTNLETSFFGDRIKVEALRADLRLPAPPEVVECFDISHLAGTSTVGVMVQFRNGRPDRRNYRRFLIRTVEGIDDFAAITEVVRRRYARLKRDGSDLPDLIVVDGGRGQLSAAKSALDELGLAIPLIALAKREEDVWVPGLSVPLPLDRKAKGSLFLQEVRDEAHRFAITYNRTLRSKAVLR
ncbi:MAG: excinuclease ABC subunit C [Methanospirillum sp.]|nr:excinuclease ABC subunit C [Methanospirillum sp.]